ncbi:MAG: ABC transporter permease [Dethiobacter sp.]|nr:ABC transporter permease [Dethiobacter sp.]
MQLKDIALASLKVRKAKTFFLVIGILIGVASLVTFSTVAATLQDEVNFQFEEQGLKLLVLPLREQLSLSYRGITVASGLYTEKKGLSHTILDDLKEILREYPAAIAPRVAGQTNLSGKDALLVGIIPSEEVKLRPWWEAQKGSLPQEGELLLGYQLASKLAIVQGDLLTASNQILTVAGILSETGEQDDLMAFATIETASRILGVKELSFIEVAIPLKKEDSSKAGIITELLREQTTDTEVIRVQNEVGSRLELAESFTRLSRVVTLVILFTGAIIVMVTMMGSVHERRAEIGAFRAMGYRSSHVAKIILTEAVFVGIAGGFSGYLLGLLLSLPAGRLLANTTVRITFKPYLFFTVFVVALVISTLASLYPAYRASRLDPIDSMRHI